MNRGTKRKPLIWKIGREVWNMILKETRMWGVKFLRTMSKDRLWNTTIFSIATEEVAMLE
jgi:hypothetical protein